VGRRIVLFGQKCFRNSPPMRRAPVPERDWTRAILSSLTLGDEAPKTRLDTNLPYSGNPVMGAYSIVIIHGSEIDANLYREVLPGSVFLPRGHNSRRTVSLYHLYMPQHPN